MTEDGPVTDWATDFDPVDPAWTADPYPIWDDLRQRCPVAHTGRYGGAWMPVTHDLVSEVAYDTEHFTSRSVVMSEYRPGPDDPPAPIGLTPPVTSDPPFHHLARRILVPAFGPGRIAELEGFTRELCKGLLDELVGETTVDGSVDYARHIPLRVTLEFLGFPRGDADLFRRFIERSFGDVHVSTVERQALIAEMHDYMQAQIDDHRLRPRDDITSFLLGADIGGEPLTPEFIRGCMILLMIAGIDTTRSAIGASLWHLAQHPDDRRRLVDEPELIGVAVEELLRAYAPATMARLVARDFEFHGHALKQGEWLLLPFPAANRDPAVFDDPDQVRFDRAEGRHAAFGLGIHRCLGANLARMELRVALEEWLARFPDFELTNSSAVSWSVGQVRGPRELPLRVA